MTATFPMTTTSLISAILESTKREVAYEKLTNDELVSQLVREFWADLPLFTEKSDLIGEVISRLKGKEATRHVRAMEMSRMRHRTRLGRLLWSLSRRR